MLQPQVPEELCDIVAMGARPVFLLILLAQGLDQKVLVVPVVFRENVPVVIVKS